MVFPYRFHTITSSRCRPSKWYNADGRRAPADPSPLPLRLRSHFLPSSSSFRQRLGRTRRGVAGRGRTYRKALPPGDGASISPLRCQAFHLVRSPQGSWSSVPRSPCTCRALWRSQRRQSPAHPGPHRHIPASFFNRSIGAAQQGASSCQWDVDVSRGASRSRWISSIAFPWNSLLAPHPTGAAAEQARGKEARRSAPPPFLIFPPRGCLRLLLSAACAHPSEPAPLPPRACLCEPSRVSGLPPPRLKGPPAVFVLPPPCPPLRCPFLCDRSLPFSVRLPHLLPLTVLSHP